MSNTSNIPLRNNPDAAENVANGTDANAAAANAAAAGGGGSENGSGPKQLSPLSPSVLNFLKLSSLIAPLFLVMLLVIISVINSDVKGLIYLMGIMFLFIIVICFNSIIPFNLNKEGCTLWGNNYLGRYNFPSFYTSLYAFTILYILYPMIVNGAYNFPLITILLALYIFDIIIRFCMMHCTNFTHIVLGTVLGLLFSLFYLSLFTNNPELLYYNDFISDKIACSVPSSQKFKCSVYNNGQLLQTISPNV